MAESASPPKIKRRKGPSKDRFDRIFSDGRVVKSSSFRLIALEGAGLVGIATSRSIGCHAARNKIKRRLREIVRAAESSLLPHLDYVVVASQSSAKRTFEELTQEFQRSIGTLNQRWANEPASS